MILIDITIGLYVPNYVFRVGLKTIKINFAQGRF